MFLFFSMWMMRYSLGSGLEQNIINLTYLLDCFNGISGLKINRAKSNILGVGVHDVEINAMTQLINCKPGSD